MIGCYDFCGHYEATFQWLHDQGGSDMLKAYWEDAIAGDSQQHARNLIVGKGFEGMLEYWDHTLAEESPDREYSLSYSKNLVRIDMRDCPSKGFLIRNGLKNFPDYCDHCMGWIGPVMRDAGFVIDHEHNHCGQCWWEFRRADDSAPASKPGTASENDVRLSEEWREGQVDRFKKALSSEEKTSPSQET